MTSELLSCLIKFDETLGELNEAIKMTTVIINKITERYERDIEYFENINRIIDRMLNS